MQAFLKVTLVKGKLYLRRPSQNPDFLNSHTNLACERQTFLHAHWNVPQRRWARRNVCRSQSNTNSVFLNSRKRPPAPVKGTFFASRIWCPSTRASNVLIQRITVSKQGARKKKPFRKAYSLLRRMVPFCRYLYVLIVELQDEFNVLAHVRSIIRPPCKSRAYRY